MSSKYDRAAGRYQRAMEELSRRLMSVALDRSSEKTRCDSARSILRQFDTELAACSRELSEADTERQKSEDPSSKSQQMRAVRPGGLADTVGAILERGKTK